MLENDTDSRVAATRGTQVSRPVIACGRPRFCVTLFSAAFGLLFSAGLSQAGSLPKVRLPAWQVMKNTGSLQSFTSGTTRADFGTNRLDIHQFDQRVILDWEEFNIDRGNTVEFHQPSSTAVALNRIFQNGPSTIAGKLIANGQVYLLNQNGILFDDGAQVNVHSLVASALNIEGEVFNGPGGITGAINEGNFGNPAFTVFASEGGSGQRIPGCEATCVKVETGASLSTAEGGLILLVAPEVINNGVLETPGGQAILAAGYDKVYVALPKEKSEGFNGQGFSGLLVEVGTGGKVTNAGTISAERGNVSMIGLAVNQNGRVSATTAVNFNGSVRLAARHKPSPNALGNLRNGLLSGNQEFSTLPVEADPLQEFGVSFGASSLTEVLPDLDSGDTAIDEQLQSPSRIDVSGATVVLHGGARLVAPGGEVTIDANARGDVSRSRVVVQAGAVIDVSGSEVVLPMSRNQGEIELRGNELADFPLQRGGVLRGETIKFDLREPPAIGNVQAVYDALARDVGERTASGGSVSLTSQGAIQLDKGALIDISGGSVSYQAGFIEASFVVSTDGRVFRISEANPNLVYDRVLPRVSRTHAKWGVTRTWNVFGTALNGAAQFQPAYIEGRDAGRLNLVAPDIQLAASVQAGRVLGAFQRLPAETLELGRFRPFDQIPLGGALGIGAAILPPGGGTIQGVLGPELLVLGDSPIPADTRGLALNDNFFETSGINRLTALAETARVESDFEVDLGAGADIDITTIGDIEFAGSIRAAGGEVALTTAAVIPATDRPGIHLAETARIDTRGNWVNDNPLITPQVALAPLLIDGGSVTLKAKGDLLLEHGSVIDVGGGAQFTAEGDIETGAAGAITLSSRVASGLVSESELRIDGELRGFALQGGGQLNLEGAGFVIGQAPLVGTHQIALAPDFFQSGGFSDFTLSASSTLDNNDLTLIEVADNTRIEVLQENLVLDFGADRVAGGTDINTFSTRRVLRDFQRTPTGLSFITKRRGVQDGSLTAGIHIGAGASLRTQAGGQLSLAADDRIVVAGGLSAPAGAINLTLNDAGAPANRGEGIWLMPGSRIDVGGVAQVFSDALGRRTGSVLPGGAINLQAKRGYLVLAPGSVLDVSGARARVDRISTDSVGAVPVPGGFSIASAAGRIDLSASEGILFYADMDAHGGGSNSADGSLSVALDIGARRANNAGSIGDFLVNPRVVALGERRAFDNAWLAFSDADFTTPFNSNAFDGDNAIIDPAAGGPVAGLNGLAVIAPETVLAAGFDYLRLNAIQADKQSDRNDARRSFSEAPAEIRFLGDVQLDLDGGLTLDAPIISSDGGSAGVSASYVQVGSSNDAFRVNSNAGRRSANLFDPAPGEGELTVEAGLIDFVGFTALRGFRAQTDSALPGASAPVRFSARGDIRLRGVGVSRLTGDPAETANTQITGWLASVGDIDFESAQLYPTTFSDFSLASDGAIRFLGTGATAPAPLSAGGSLTVSAADIVQAGVLRAPLGTLRFGRYKGATIADIKHAEDTSAELASNARVRFESGSLTSVSADGRVVPFGQLVLQDNWVFDVNDTLRAVDEPRLNNTDGPRDQPWEKTLLVDSEDFEFAPDALVDLSGGGDTITAGFQPGPGGSVDILRASDDFAFAVLPTLGSEFAAFDPLLKHDTLLASELSPELPSLPLGELALTVDIAPGSGLPVGRYAVLPRGYAVLPGAYLVTPVRGGGSVAPNRALTGNDGVATVAARFGVAGTQVLQAQSLAVRVENRDQVFNRAEYLLASGNSFLEQRAELRGEAPPQRPLDGGRMLIAASEILRLQGALAEDNGVGRSSQVDISADRLAVVTALSAAPETGVVELLGADLNGLNAGSLLLGGRRSDSTTGAEISVDARQVTVDDGVALAMPELLLVGRDEVSVRDGASITATDAVVSGNRRISIAGLQSETTPTSVALLRVSAGEQVELVGDVAPTDGGNLLVAGGSSVFASGSITAIGTGEVTLDGALNTDAGSISLVAPQISIGDAPDDTPGLVLADFANLGAEELILSSRGSIDFFGAVNARIQTLVLDSANLVGRRLEVADGAPQAATVDIKAGRIRLGNRNGGTPGAGENEDSGSLTFTAGTIELADGAYLLDGFADTVFNAEQVTLRGASRLTVDGDLTLNTARLDSAVGGFIQTEVSGTASLLPLAGVDTTATALDYRTTAEANLIKTPATVSAAGGRFNLTASAINVDTRVVLPSGALALKTTEGDIVLGADARLDVAGQIETFADVAYGTYGGTVTLSADQGAVRLDKAARIDVSGAAAINGADTVDGGDAGTLEINVPGQAFDLAAVENRQLLGGLWLPDNRGELVFVDVASLRDASQVKLDGIAARLAAAGVSLNAAQLGALRRGFEGGRFRLDTDSLIGDLLPVESYSRLGQALSSGGFGAEQKLRVRSGNLLVDGLVRATRVSMTADRGRIDVTGDIDASAQRGGTVRLNAGLDLELLDGASITATALGEQQRGGEVYLSSRDGQVVSGQVDDVQAPLIDVSGSGEFEHTGLVRLTAARTADNLDLQVAPIHADVRGAERLELVGTQVYADQTTVDAALFGSLADNPGDSIGGDTTQFMGGATSILARLDPGNALSRTTPDADGNPATESFLHLLPGVEIQSSGELTLAESVDLAGWRAGGEPGVLTLRAAGKLLINADLSDGLLQRASALVRAGADPFSLSLLGLEGSVSALDQGRSWSYQLITGADLQSRSADVAATAQDSADVLATVARESADLELADGVRVRTGSGAIDLAVGGDLIYGRGASIQTLGENALQETGFELSQVETGFLGSIFGTAVANKLDIGAYVLETLLPGSGFGRNGGDIRGRIAGDVVQQPGSGAQDLLFTDWLQVLADKGGVAVPSLWAVRYDAFDESLGSLGGGSINIEVGGTAENFTLALPTTGIPDGAGWEYEFTVNSFQPGFVATGINAVQESGGGDLHLDVGGDILSGVFLAGSGTADIRAGGQIAAVDDTALNTVLALGDAGLTVTGGAGATVEAVYNFTLPGQDGSGSGFFTYGESSAVAINALGEDVALLNRVDANLRVYPGELSVRAGGGDILFGNQGAGGNPVQLFPAPNSSLELLAGGNIADIVAPGATNPVQIEQLDADPGRFPTPEQPLPVLFFGAPGYDHALIPVHTGDFKSSRLVARTGSIGAVQANGKGIQLTLAEAGLISAGRDIINLNLDIQHPNPGDVSVIQAGRDIRYTPFRDDEGNFVTRLPGAGSGVSGIQVGGPGSVAVMAGRSIDLGTSDGIVTLGDQVNINLPDGGADVSVLAGLGGGADYDALFQTLVAAAAPFGSPVDGQFSLRGRPGRPLTDALFEEMLIALGGIEGVRLLPDDEGKTSKRVGDSLVVQLQVDSEQAVSALLSSDLFEVDNDDLVAVGLYRNAVQNFMQLRSGVAVALADSLDAFNTLPRRVNRDLLLDVFFNELKASGVAATQDDNEGFGRGFAAIDLLFPEAAPDSGNLSMLLSSIKTQAGGDIRFLNPGGGANVGAAALDGLAKKESDLGIVAQASGNVSAFVRDNFLVNASRVFALRSGAVTIWSSFGNIDAGRGARSALSAPAPEIRFDENGTAFTFFPATVSGSGIRNFEAPEAVPRSVFLFAPNGVVDAGDAGIGSASDIFVAASQVLGAGNFDVAGVAVGVPVSDTSIAAGLTGVSNIASSTSKVAEETASIGAGDGSGFGDDQQLGLLFVELLGFGE